jgi:hypothetical protein
MFQDIQVLSGQLQRSGAKLDDKPPVKASIDVLSCEVADNESATPAWPKHRLQTRLELALQVMECSEPLATVIYRRGCRHRLI